MIIAIRIVPRTAAYNDVTGVYNYTNETAVDFYSEEIHDYKKLYESIIQIQKSQKQAPAVFDKLKGSEGDGDVDDRYAFEINVFHKWSTTQAKVEDLFDEDHILHRLYWKYAEDQSTYLDCILDRNRTRKYFWGSEGAEIYTRLLFYEAA